MTKAELEKEAEESFEQYKVTDEDYVVSPYSDDMGEKMLMYNDEYYAEETYLRLYTQGYLAGAEPREKRIEELEEKLKKETTQRIYNFNKSIEWKEKHRELEAQINNLQTMLQAEREVRCNEDYLRKVTDLEAQIEKLIDFVLSKTECCDVCPITDTCINSEGTCSYAGILAKGEEEVTRKWLMQFISKEIKEKRQYKNYQTK